MAKQTNSETLKQNSPEEPSTPVPSRHYFFGYLSKNEKGESVISPITQAPSSFQERASNISRTLDSSKRLREELSTQNSKAWKRKRGERISDYGERLARVHFKSGREVPPL